jgi:hypothetical protein
LEIEHTRDSIPLIKHLPGGHVLDEGVRSVEQIEELGPHALLSFIFIKLNSRVTIPLIEYLPLPGGHVLDEGVRPVEQVEELENTAYRITTSICYT